MGKQLSTKLNIYHRKFAFRIKQLSFLGHVSSVWYLGIKTRQTTEAQSGRY